MPQRRRKRETPLQRNLRAEIAELTGNIRDAKATNTMTSRVKTWEARLRKAQQLYNESRAVTRGKPGY